MTEREHGRGEGREPLDEEAAWAQIVAGYDRDGQSPAESRLTTESDKDPLAKSTEDDAATSGESVTDREPTALEEPTETGVPTETGDRSSGNLLEKRPTGDDEEQDQAADDDRGDGEQPADGGQGIRTFTVYAAGTGPRDWRPAEDEEGEGHFVPPEPPPLPKLDTTARLAWLAVLGGPALLFGAVIFQIPMDWWMITVGVGGFLGGFGTLVARMRDDEDFDDPGRGAIV